MKTAYPAFDHFARFSPGATYHVYNRTNNCEPLFHTDGNRRFFLSQYHRYLSDYVDTFAWCLMENHFHLSIRVKPAEVITQVVLRTPEEERTAAQRQFLEMPDATRDFHAVVERQFTRLFTAYAMHFNKQFQRSGNLFYRPFKRIAIQKERQQLVLIYYIHANIVKHGVLTDFQNYPWSSYPAYLSDKATKVCKQEVLDWFGGLEGFLAFHRMEQDQEDWFEDLGGPCRG